MESQVLDCAHCGNKTKQEKIFHVIGQETAYLSKDPEDTMDYDVYYTVVKCTTCQNISLFANTEFDDNPENLFDAHLCYPHEKRIEKQVPEIISKNYLEAKKVMKVSNPAFAIMIRRGLEFICKEQKAKGRSLKAKLEDLVKREIIPTPLAEMGDTLRVLGNIGAHATEYVIDQQEIQAMNDFYLAMNEYV
ncbi:MAG: DUF4145 domain-containing protein [Bacteroidales bacterium]|nr:DUF4145 domain-containing protein [Bacteroidales bacterium]